MPNSLRLGVAMPLANEEATVIELLQQILARLTERDRVFCVLDNVSRDHTRQRVQEMARQDPRVVEVWAPENRCVVDAYFRGYRAALEAGCQWILEMDGGLSHRPDEIPRFIQAMEAGADFAAGSRFAPGGQYIGRRSRYLLSWGGSLLARLMLGAKMRDMTSGFECFSRPAMTYLVAKGVRSRAHFFQTEIRHMMHPWKWVEVPITYSNPSTRAGSKVVLEALRNLWWLSRQKPRAAPPLTGKISACSLMNVWIVGGQQNLAAFRDLNRDNKYQWATEAQRAQREDIKRIRKARTFISKTGDSKYCPFLFPLRLCGPFSSICGRDTKSGHTQSEKLSQKPLARLAAADRIVDSIRPGGLDSAPGPAGWDITVWRVVSWR